MMTKADADRLLLRGTNVEVLQDNGSVEHWVVDDDPPYKGSHFEANGPLIRVVRFTLDGQEKQGVFFSRRFSLSNPYSDLEVGPDHDEG